MIWASALLLGGGISGDGPTYGPAVATAAVCSPAAGASAAGLLRGMCPEEPPRAGAEGEDISAGRVLRRLPLHVACEGGGGCSWEGGVAECINRACPAALGTL